MQAYRAQGLLRTLVARTVASRNGYHSDHPIATYNDLPSPQGCWQTHHDAMQRKYNSHLLFGVAFFAATLIVAKASGALYLNYSEPDAPAENLSYD